MCKHVSLHSLFHHITAGALVFTDALLGVKTVVNEATRPLEMFSWHVWN